MITSNCIFSLYRISRKRAQKTIQSEQASLSERLEGNPDIVEGDHILAAPGASASVPPAGNAGSGCAQHAPTESDRAVLRDAQVICVHSGVRAILETWVGLHVCPEAWFIPGFILQNAGLLTQCISNFTPLTRLVSSSTWISPVFSKERYVKITSSDCEPLATAPSPPFSHTHGLWEGTWTYTNSCLYLVCIFSRTFYSTTQNCGLRTAPPGKPFNQFPVTSSRQNSSQVYTHWPITEFKSVNLALLFRVKMANIYSMFPMFSHLLSAVHASFIFYLNLMLLQFPAYSLNSYLLCPSFLTR